MEVIGGRRVFFSYEIDLSRALASDNLLFALEQSLIDANSKKLKSVFKELEQEYK